MIDRGRVGLRVRAHSSNTCGGVQYQPTRLRVLVIGIVTAMLLVGFWLPASAAGPAPTVTGVSPATGSTAGGTVVTVIGTNLGGTKSVTFAGTVGTALTVVSATQLRVISPTHAAGTVDVRVATIRKRAGRRPLRPLRTA